MNTTKFDPDIAIIRGAAIAIVAVILFTIIFSSCYTVNQGDRAVLMRFGRIIEVSDPGFHFKLPAVDSVQKVSVRTRKTTHKIHIYSKDIQGAEIELSLNYSINAGKVADIYSQYGMLFEDRIIRPQVLAKPRDIFGKYNAVDIVQNREKLTSEILLEFSKQFSETGIIAESVQIENIDFSDEYERSVEERMKAEVEVQKVKQNLEREKLNADMVRTKAQGEADARIASARAEAESIRLKGSAEAVAIKAKSEAFAQSPDYVRLIEAERWNGTLPQTMIPNGAIPIIKSN